MSESSASDASPLILAGEPGLRRVLEAAAGTFYCVDTNGVTTLCNRSFLDMLGYDHDSEVLGMQLHDVIHHSHADGSFYDVNDCPIYKAARAGVRAHVKDEVFFRKDGSSFPVEYWVRPIVNEGRIEGAVCTINDLTEQQAAQAYQGVLNSELAHRIKNILSSVQAIVSQSLRNATTPMEANVAISDRLMVLSHAHDILTRSNWQAAPIEAVIEGAIAVHRDRAAAIHIEGPPIRLAPKPAVALALAMHELCTNATKFGALAAEKGVVSIEWGIDRDKPETGFWLSWTERGGPTVAKPSRSGFGSRLTTTIIEAEFSGKTFVNYAETGFTWNITAPLSSITEK